MATDNHREQVSDSPETFHAGKALRDVRVQIRRLTFTGNRSIRLDSGATLQPPPQHWSPTAGTLVLFEGLFCIPVVSVELKLSAPLSAPARMTLIGDADNGMVFSRDFTFPAGKPRKGVTGLRSDRPAGGVFGLITRVNWRLQSADVQVILDGPATSVQNIYFLPRWDGDRPPSATVVHIVCRALKGLEPGHPSALEKVWQVIEALDVTTADGKTDLRCGVPTKKQETAEDLLRNGSGGAAAWIDLFRRCLHLAARHTEVTPSEEHTEWPWTVDSFALKEKLLEAKCQHVLREMRSL